jgi:hypothetical protein
LLTETLCDARALDFMVALGMHPLLSEAALCCLVGIAPEARCAQYAQKRALGAAAERQATRY